MFRETRRYIAAKKLLLIAGWKLNGGFDLQSLEQYAGGIIHFTHTAGLPTVYLHTGFIDNTSPYTLLHLSLIHI